MKGDPISVEIQSSRQYFFVLLGSASVISFRKMLIKLTTGIDFTNNFPLFHCLIVFCIFFSGVINILRATFLPIFWRQNITKPNVTEEKQLSLLSYGERTHKMLMKLTPEPKVILLFVNKKYLRQ